MPRDFDEYPPILDTEQAAELLGMDVRKVRREVREGRLTGCPACKGTGSSGTN